MWTAYNVFVSGWLTCHTAGYISFPFLAGEFVALSQGNDNWYPISGLLHRFDAFYAICVLI
jgi:hypothetical protein